MGVLLLILAGLFLRGVTPSGWMPNPQGALTAPMVLCTAEGSRLLQLDAQGHPAGHRSGGRHDTCAFAGHAFAAPPPPLAASDRVIFVSFAAQRSGDHPSPAIPTRHREQAPRGPPTSI